MTATEVTIGQCESCDTPVVLRLGTGRRNCECAYWILFMPEPTAPDLPAPGPKMAGIQRPKELTIQIDHNQRQDDWLSGRPPAYGGVQGMMI